jgi:hypothetical protein
MYERTYERHLIDGLRHSSAARRTLIESLSDEACRFLIDKVQHVWSTDHRRGVPSPDVALSDAHDVLLAILELKGIRTRVQWTPTSTLRDLMFGTDDRSLVVKTELDAIDRIYDEPHVITDECWHLHGHHPRGGGRYVAAIHQGDVYVATDTGTSNMVRPEDRGQVVPIFVAPTEESEQRFLAEHDLLTNSTWEVVRLWEMVKVWREIAATDDEAAAELVQATEEFLGISADDDSDTDSSAA